MKEITIKHKLSDKEMTCIEIQSIETVGKKYLILDAALWDVEIETAYSFGNKYCCLFATRGADHELNAVAPYVFEYEDGDELSNWVRYKESKGMRSLYIYSTFSMEQLRKHLRQFLRVKTADGKWLFFRFYDPKVAHVSIPILTNEQRALFFIGIEHIGYYQTKANHEYVTLVSDIAQYINSSETIKSKSLLPLMITNDQLTGIKDAMLVVFHQQMFFALKSSKYFPKLSVEEIYKIIEKQTQKLIKYGINGNNNSKIFIETSFRYSVLCRNELPVELSNVIEKYSDETQKVQAIVNHLNYNNYVC